MHVADVAGSGSAAGSRLYASISGTTSADSINWIKAANEDILIVGGSFTSGSGLYSSITIMYLDSSNSLVTSVY